MTTNRLFLPVMFLLGLFFWGIWAVTAAMPIHTAVAAPIETSNTLLFSTYLGGENAECASIYRPGCDVAVAPDGSIYVVGQTSSPNSFPVLNPTFGFCGGGTCRNNEDAFLSKFSPDGTLLFSTHFGGQTIDGAYGVDVGKDGRVYIVGHTSSTPGEGFPVTNNAAQADCIRESLVPEVCASADAFLAVFAANGSLEYATYLGGKGNDYAYDVAVDDEGNVVVVGITGGIENNDFPTTAGSFQPTTNEPGINSQDGFVAKYDTNGQLLYSSLLGGQTTDTAVGVAVDNDGYAYVTGYTLSNDFPTQDPLYTCTDQPSAASCLDIFVTKVMTDGSGLAFSTFLSKDELSQDEGHAIALDEAGDIYITGIGLANSGSSAFVAKMAGDGSKLLYATSLNETYKQAWDLAVDKAGQAYVVGTTADTPTTQDAFWLALNTRGNVLAHGRVGGTEEEVGWGIALDPNHGLYLMGNTTSTNFPTIKAHQDTIGGDTFGDAFVTQVDTGFTIGVAQYKVMLPLVTR